VTSTQASSLYLGSYQVLADRDGPGVAPSEDNLNLKLNFKLDLQVTTSMKGTGLDRSSQPAAPKLFFSESIFIDYY
jgi:hypothetical protein